MNQFKYILLLILIPFFSFGQHYANTDIIVQTEVQKESKMVPVKYLSRTLLIHRNVAIELGLKRNQEINTREDFYYILNYNTRFINEQKVKL